MHGPNISRSLRASRAPGLVIATLAAGAVSAYFATAAAQPARIQAAASDDLRAVYANAADIAEGKRVAETSCAACHGPNGISTTQDVPHLAGQRAAYLHFELKAYKSGMRGDNAMAAAVKFLSDDALLKAAAYFASLEPPVPAAAGKPPPSGADPMQAGKALAAGCAGCHGDTGASKTAGTPSLVGLDPEYLVASMKAYKGGQRKNDLMKSMLAKAEEPDLKNVALYYALQKPARAQTAAAGDQASGKAAAAACSGCHGELGVSATPATPSLAGQDAQYLAAALKGYKDGARSDETMKGIAAALDDAAIKNISAFYAAQSPQAPNVQKPLSVAEWVQRCDRCHGVNGNSTDPRLPALAAQRADYLQKVLRAYRTGARKSPQMAAMSEVLTDNDIDNLAGYYSRQRARSVLYVTLPAK